MLIIIIIIMINSSRWSPRPRPIIVKHNVCNHYHNHSTLSQPSLSLSSLSWLIPLAEVLEATGSSIKQHYVCQLCHYSTLSQLSLSLSSLSGPILLAEVLETLGLSIVQQYFSHYYHNYVIIAHYHNHHYHDWFLSQKSWKHQAPALLTITSGRPI